MTKGALPLAHVLAFALMGLPMAMASLPFALHIPNLYTSGMGLSLAAVGTGLMLIRLADVLVDPVVGAMVDRWPLWRSHRKAWICLGLVPTTLGAYQVLTPVVGVGLSYLLAWSALFYLGWTVMSIPLQSWAAEMSSDYHQRSRIRAWIEAFTTVGTILAAAVPLVVAGDVNQGMSVLAIGLAISFPLLTVWLVVRVPEMTLVRDGKEAGSELKAWRRAWGNRHFRPLGLAYVINGIGDALSAVVVLFYIDHVLNAGPKAGLFLGCLFAAALLSVPVWLKLSYIFEKHRTWRWSLLWGGCFFAGIPWLGPGDDWIYLLLCVGGGTAFAADAVLPSAMLADVVDSDTAQSGVQRTGLYFGLWAVLTKLALALPAGLALPVLQWLGFDAQTGGTATGQWAVALLYGAGPIICRLIAWVLMGNYGLNQAQQSALQQAIDEAT